MGSSKEKHSGDSKPLLETSIPFDSERSAAVVVAHPDDETLWVGGVMLMHPGWRWRVISLSRGNDSVRRPRFFSAMKSLGSRGSIGDMDDGPEQHPLIDRHVQEAVRRGLENAKCDLLVTHSPFGEYSRHVRHEEVGRAVLHLWRAGELAMKELWMFAYTDSKKTHYPSAIDNAHLDVLLPEEIWKKKLAILQDVYGFAPDSWEAMTAPKKEAFWRFSGPEEALAWQNGMDIECLTALSRRT